MPGTVGPGGARAPESIDTGLPVCGRCRCDRTYALFRQGGGRGWRRRRLGRRFGGTGGWSGFSGGTVPLSPLLLRQPGVLLPLLFPPLVLFPRELFPLLLALSRGLAFLWGEC